MPDIKHIIDKYARPITLEGSVVLVGNSDQLPEQELGDFIDSHDTVFRFNLAPTGDPVGNKTDFRLLCPKVSMHDYATYNIAELNWLAHLCKSSNILCYPRMSRHVKDHCNLYRFLLTDVKQCNKVIRKLLGHKTDCVFPKNNHPRNGIKLLLALLDDGVRPALAGFDLEPRIGANHYYNDEPQKEVTQGFGHRPSLEYRLLKELGFTND